MPEALSRFIDAMGEPTVFTPAIAVTLATLAEDGPTGTFVGDEGEVPW
jgi:hypothetical protein